MRPGPPRGETATLEVAVTEAMASSAGSTLPPSYGMAAMAEHVEQVCRQLLVPHLEPGEEGVAVRIDLTLRAPVPPGETVTLTATVAQVGPQRLVSEVLIHHAGRMVARGSFEHAVTTRDAYDVELTAQ